MAYAADDHAFEHGVRVAFQNAPVHKRARVAFIRIAGEVLRCAGGHAGQLPFLADGEACAAAPAQA